MKYTQITVTTTTQASELVAYYLQEVCLDGINIVDKNDLKVGNWDYMEQSVTDSFDDNVYCIGYANIEDTDSVLLFLSDQLSTLDQGLYGRSEIAHTIVEEVDWVSNWQQNFRPIDFGTLVVCPQWIHYQSNDKPILLLDNGAAFGTGQHQTTAMCIKLMSSLELADKRILDVGCGSGILALSSLLLGGAHATLVDIDPMCTDTAYSNASVNGLLERCDIVCGNLCDKVSGRFDVVLANLTADILYALSGDIATTIKYGSKLILSGILADRVDNVITCYQDIGCKLISRLEDGEWSGLLMEYVR